MRFPTASTANAKGFICWLMMQCSIMGSVYDADFACTSALGGMAV